MRFSSKLMLAVPMLMAASPAFACVSDVPAFSVTDMSSFLFLGASATTLVVLGYMYLKPAAKAIVRRFMGLSALLLVGVIAVLASYSAIDNYMRSHATVTAPVPVHSAPP